VDNRIEVEGKAQAIDNLPIGPRTRCLILVNEIYELICNRSEGIITINRVSVWKIDRRSVRSRRIVLL